MTRSQNEFQLLVRGYLADRGRDPADVEETDDYMLEAGGRVVQLRLADNGAMLASTMIFYNDGMPERVLETAIAEFNAFHLFAGGYCLLVDERSGSIYVEQAVKVERFDVAEFTRYLGDFADRATSCARWYLKEVERSEAAATPPQAVFV